MCFYIPVTSFYKRENIFHRMRFYGLPIFSGITSTGSRYNRKISVNSALCVDMFDADEDGNIASMTVEHAKANAGLWKFSYQEMPPGEAAQVIG